MHENTGRVNTTSSLKEIKAAILKAANMGVVQSLDENRLKFIACTFSSKVPVLCMVKVSEGSAYVTSNCEKMVIGSMLVKLVKETITSL